MNATDAATAAPVTAVAAIVVMDGKLCFLDMADVMDGCTNNWTAACTLLLEQEPLREAA